MLIVLEMSGPRKVKLLYQRLPMVSFLKKRGEKGGWMCMLW